MHKQAPPLHRLADQDSNWRRPRSPALNIPVAREGNGSRQPRSAGNATSDAAWPRSHLRNLSNANTNHRSAFSHTSSSKRSSSLERTSKDASSAESWRSHHASKAADRNQVMGGGSLGSMESLHQPAQRRHAGFHASSNASEVARRAFVATEIGSIGRSGRAAPSKSLNAVDTNRSTATAAPIPSAAPLRHLKVEGFNTPSIPDASDDSFYRDLRQRREDWAATPTSSLPSLPSSPHRSERHATFEEENGQSPSISILAKRLESHQSLTGQNAQPRTSALAASGFIASPKMSSLSRDIAYGSPQRGPRPGNQAHNSSLDRVAGQHRANNASPRRAPDLRSFESSPRPPPSRKNSSTSLASHRLQHSRRDSLSSQLSSPSMASIASSRPLYGVYRPPHLRNRGSTSGLQAVMTHYDRVRTPSLRGIARSPEPPSRPASTVPNRTFLVPGIPEESQFPTPVADSQASQAAVAEQRGREGYFDLPPSRYGSRSPVASGPERATTDAVDSQQVPGEDSTEDVSQHVEDFDMSHEDMIQTQTSLTDSYCLSRRSSMLSNFQVGNGMPVVDIFQVGDRLGPGMIHDGYPITIAETSSGFSKQQSDVTGTRLEVLSKLGEGSYAVVYLVQEVAGDGQIFVGAKDDLSNFTQNGQPISVPEQEEDGETGDATLGDTTIAGTLLARRRPSLEASTFTEDDYSSTFKARDQKPRDTLATRAAAADDAERTALSQHPPGIDLPQEGRRFALKCLCKRDLSDEMLEVQRLEATIHQSIPPHKNIVTLYRTYETPEWLFLALEYCPGQDLFYWLEQARDSDIEDIAQGQTTARCRSPSTPSRKGDESPDGTPPSPSLLATTSIDALLSRRRLRLISKMFRQMCDAVQFCHDRGIAHRDIKPENFIVEDRRHEHVAEPDDDAESLAGSEDLRGGHTEQHLQQNGFRRPTSSQRRVSTASMSTTLSNESSATLSAAKVDVVVKLTDFGLATAETHCQDFDCGSKPYMAYECRNNITETYDPQQADIWSLGIVLLNLIFHRSPFREPHLERCDSFASYCTDPIGFLMESFEGLTEETARFLSDNVLCNIVTGLQDAAEGREPSQKRVSAREFGRWAKTLPAHFGLGSNQPSKRLTRGYSLDLTSPLMHSRAGSNSSTLPSILSSPRPMSANLVIEEDDDKGFADHPLFPEYSANGDESLASPTPGGNHGVHHWPVSGADSPDILPSPTFSPAPPQSAPSDARTASPVSPPGSAKGQPDHPITAKRLAPPRVVVHAHDDVGTGWASASADKNRGFSFGAWSADGPGGKWNGHGHSSTTIPTQASMEPKNDSRQTSALAKLLEKERLNDKQRVPSWRSHRERRESRR